LGGGDERQDKETGRKREQGTQGHSKVEGDNCYWEQGLEYQENYKLDLEVCAVGKSIETRCGGKESNRSSGRSSTSHRWRKEASFTSASICLERLRLVSCSDFDLLLSIFSSLARRRHSQSSSYHHRTFLEQSLNSL